VGASESDEIPAEWKEFFRSAVNLTMPLPTLRVYAVWLPMVWSDARRAWDSGLLADPRVTHLWDEKRTTGLWFAEHLEGYRGISSDTYYLYGPDAKWDLTPTPLISRGRTIDSQRRALQASILPLLED
jgi:hypothetical protein